LARQYYLTAGGNMQVARALAAHDLKNHWGVTTVNGQREFMEYAPEAKGVNGETVRGELEAMFPGKNAKLVADHQTEVSEGTKFSIAVPNSLGQYDILRGANGRPRTYDLPSPQAQFERDKAKARQDARAKWDRDAAQRKDREGEMFQPSALPMYD